MAATTASNHEIARLANAHARADFATWQMMAKLKSISALPSDAQDFYAGYLKLLERKSTAEAAAEATIQQVYVRYYEKMGGTGKPPRIEPAPRGPPTPPPVSNTNNVTPFRRIKPTPAPSAPGKKRSLPVALIFLGLIALAVAFHYAKNGL